MLQVQVQDLLDPEAVRDCDLLLGIREVRQAIFAGERSQIWGKRHPYPVDTIGAEAAALRAELDGIRNKRELTEDQERPAANAAGYARRSASVDAPVSGVHVSPTWTVASE